MDMSEKIIVCIVCIIVILFFAIAVLSVNDSNKTYDLSRECESSNGVYVKEYGSSIYRCVKLERMNKPYADYTN